MPRVKVQIISKNPHNGYINYHLSCHFTCQRSIWVVHDPFAGQGSKFTISAKFHNTRFINHYLSCDLTSQGSKWVVNGPFAGFRIRCMPRVKVHIISKVPHKRFTNRYLTCKLTCQRSKLVVHGPFAWFRLQHMPRVKVHIISRVPHNRFTNHYLSCKLTCQRSKWMVYCTFGGFRLWNKGQSSHQRSSTRHVHKLSLELLLEESVDMTSTSSSFSLFWPGAPRSRFNSVLWWLMLEGMVRLAVSSLEGCHVMPPPADAETSAGKWQKKKNPQRMKDFLRKKIIMVSAKPQSKVGPCLKVWAEFHQSARQKILCLQALWTWAEGQRFVNTTQTKGFSNLLVAIDSINY